MLVLIGGAIWSVSLLPSAAWAADLISEYVLGERLGILTAIIVVLLLGWIVVPVFVTGLDDTLDPGRFASLGVSIRRLMPGLTVSAFLTVPAIFFAIVLTMFASSWSPNGGAVVTIALLGVPLTLATFVLSARLAVGWSARLLQSRRSREITFIVILVGALALVPAAYAVVADGLDSILQYEVRLALEQLPRTPLAAPLGAAEAAARGDWLGCAWRMGMSAVWVALLWAAWRANVAYTLIHPVFRGGGARPHGDAILAAARRRELRDIRPNSRPRTAVASRALRYWFTDPRYLSGLVSVCVFPVLFFLLMNPTLGSPTWLLAIVPALVAGTVGWGRHNDVAYDSTALWLDVTAGRWGRAIMGGRIQATLTWAVPLVLVAALASIAVSGRVDLAPGIVGAALGVLGTSLGVSAVTAVALPYRAPAPGENPFASEVGSIGAGLFAQFVSSIVAWAVAVPVTLPLVAAVMWDARWGWLGLVLGTATGLLVLRAGVVWSGSLYNQRSGRLVGAVS